MPADHNGGNFTFRLNFSENVEAGYARIRDHAFSITGGSMASASRITQGSNQGWNVEVDPTGNEARLPSRCRRPPTAPTPEQSAPDDERKLSHATSALVAGPPAVSVGDATVQEAEGATLEFSVIPQPRLQPDRNRGATPLQTAPQRQRLGLHRKQRGALTFNRG